MNTTRLKWLNYSQAQPLWLQVTATAAIADIFGKPLPFSVKSLKFLSVIKRDYLDIFKGTFDLVNLAHF